MPKKVLLVIECSEQFNWYEIFGKDARIMIYGSPVAIQVEQATFPDISLTSYGQGGPVVNLRKAKHPHPNTSQERDRTVVVDFILLRSVTRGIFGQDSRNILMAFMHARIPSVNSLLSAYMALERPVMWGELKAIQKQLGGASNFPLIDQNCHTSSREMTVSSDPPCVVKIGHAHAGQGKILVHDRTQWEDVRSIITLHGDYATAEPFVPADFDARVQKIGPHYRAFKRTSMNWKMNQGHGSVVEEIEVPPKWQVWADECAKACGGLDILGLDLIHDREKDTYHILELNDTAIGLVHRVAQEDNEHIRDLVLFRMTEHFNPSSSSLTSSSLTSLTSTSTSTFNDSNSSASSPPSESSPSHRDTLDCPNCKMTRFLLGDTLQRLEQAEHDLILKNLDIDTPQTTNKMLALSGLVGAILTSVGFVAISLFKSWKFAR